MGLTPMCSDIDSRITSTVYQLFARPFRSSIYDMATANVTGMERTASLALSARNVDSPNNFDEAKAAAVTERSESFTEKPKDVENIDANAPAGLREMQAITMTWSKKWLITAYCL